MKNKGRRFLAFLLIFLLSFGQAATAAPIIEIIGTVIDGAYQINEEDTVIARVYDDPGMEYDGLELTVGEAVYNINPSPFTIGGSGYFDTILDLNNIGLQDGAYDGVQARVRESIAQTAHTSNPFSLDVGYSAPPPPPGEPDPVLYLSDNVHIPPFAPPGFRTHFRAYVEDFDNRAMDGYTTYGTLERISDGQTYDLGYPGNHVGLFTDQGEELTPYRWASFDLSAEGMTAGDYVLRGGVLHLDVNGEPDGAPISATPAEGIPVKVVQELKVSVDREQGSMTIINPDENVQNDFQSFNEVVIKKFTPGQPPEVVAAYPDTDGRIAGGVVNGTYTLTINDPSAQWRMDGGYMAEVYKVKTANGKTKSIMINGSFFNVGMFGGSDGTGGPGGEGARIVYANPAHMTPGVYKEIDALKIGFSGLLRNDTVNTNTVKLLRKPEPGESSDFAIGLEQYIAVDIGVRLEASVTADNRTEIRIINKSESLSSLLLPGKRYVLVVKTNDTGVKDVNNNSINTVNMLPGLGRLFDAQVGGTFETPAYFGIEFDVAGGAFDPSQMPLTVMGSSIEGGPEVLGGELPMIPGNIKVIGAGVNKPLLATSINADNVMLEDVTAGQAVPGSVEYIFNSDSRDAIILFKPLNTLTEGNEYSFIITGGSEGIQGVNGEQLAADWIRAFEAGPAQAGSAPRVKTVNAYSTPDESRVTLFFGGQVNGTNISSANIRLFMRDTQAGAEAATDSPVDLTNARFKFDPGRMAIEIIGSGSELPISEGEWLKVQIKSIPDMFGTKDADWVSTPAAAVQIKGSEAIAIGGGALGDFQMKFMDIGAFPLNRAGGAITNFIVKLPVNEQIMEGEKIRITFPNGFDISGAAKDVMSPMNFDINGPKGEPLTISDTVEKNTFARTVTVTLQGGDTGDAVDPDHDFVSFELSGIVNPKYIDGISNQYSVQISTLDDEGNLLEGPLTTQGFNIEKSGDGSVRVTVRDQSNVIVEGIRLQLSSPMTGPMIVESGADGTYTFNDLKYGMYHLFADREQYVDGDGNVDYYAESIPVMVDVRDATIKDFTIKVKSAAQALIGARDVLVNVTDGPANAIVEIFAGSPQGFYMKKVTLNGAGAASTTLKLPDGGYGIGVRPAPENTIRNWMPPMPQFRQIASNATVNIQIHSSVYKISGQVRNNEGVGIARANVWAYNPSGTTKGAGTTTDNAGNYELYVSNGIYTVGAMAPGMPPMAELKIEVKDGNRTEIDFVAKKLDRTITVSVTDSDGATQKNIPVFAHRVDAPGTINGFIGDTGNAVLFVQPGQYKVGAFVPGYGPVELNSPTDATTADKTVVIQIQQNSTQVVSGTVLKGGQAIPGASVWAEPQGTYPGNGTIANELGEYSLRLMTGSAGSPKKYKLFTFSPDTGKIELPSAEYEEDGTLYAVAGQPALTGKDFSIASGGTITVSFTRGGNALGQVEALINAFNAQYKNSRYVNGSGTDIELKVPTSSGAYKVEVFVKGSGRYASDVTLTGGEADVTFDLPVPIAVNGTVRNSGGIAVENAWISIMRPNGSFTIGKRTGSDGVFSIEIPSYDSLKPENNNYVLTVGHPEYPQVTPIKFSVNANGSLNQSFATVTLVSEVQTVTGSVHHDNIHSYDAFVWAVTADNKWAGTKTDTSGNFSLKLSGGVWTIRAKNNGYASQEMGVQVTVSGSNITLNDPIELTATEETISAGQVNSVKPSTGGSVSDPSSGVYVLIPANAIGNSSGDYQVVTSETSNVVDTNTAKLPEGSKGVEIKIQDDSNNQLTTLDDTIEIEINYKDLLEAGSDDTLKDGSPVSSLVLGYWDNGANDWVTIPTTIDTDAKVLKGRVNHLTVFAPLLSAENENAEAETAETPVAAPAAGAYSSAQSVTLSTATEGAVIYYTTNSSTPTAASTQYTGAITVSTTTTIKAIAVKAGMNNSAVATFAYTINVPSGNPDDGNGGSGGGSSSGGGNSGSNAGTAITIPAVTPAIPQPTIETPAAAGQPVTISVPASMVNTSTGEANVAIDTATLNNALEAAKADVAGIKTVVIELPKAAGATAYGSELPAAALAGTASRKIQLATELGTITAPGNMLNASDLAGAKNVVLSIGEAAKAALDTAMKAQVGNRPVIELNVKVDGKTIAWNNPNAPVTVKIPYKPNVDELEDPEHIVVWYIDGQGKATAVPSGRYDAESGAVIFTTTHFSKYAVAYVNRTFSDISTHKWAKKAIEVMAAKGVISGSSATAYAPQAPVTRADFMVMLINALGLTAKVDSNFSDVKPTDYYYEALGIAKKLGITKGTGNNKFEPNASISRQDLMVLINRAMTAAKKELVPGTAADLEKFADKAQIAAYAEQSIVALVKSGIVTGNGKSVNPKGNASRAEAAVIVYRVYNK